MSNITKIKFGTDGWRAKMSDDFTLDNVKRVSYATAQYLKNKIKDRPITVVVGYDRRKNSKLFAQNTAEIFSSFNFVIYLFSQETPTQLVSFWVKQKKADLGVMLTASHNPAEYNGFKIKMPEGCSASNALTDEIEKLIPEVCPEVMAKAYKINALYPRDEYFARIESLIDFKKIKENAPQIVIDPIFGSGAGFFPELFHKFEIKHTEINAHRDENFGGLHPEPLAENVPGLMAAVKKLNSKYAVGLALDGDADRNGAVGTSGDFLNSQKVFCLLLHHLSQNKKLTGKVVHAFNNSRLIGKLAKSYGHEVVETKIGFKYIADYILKEPVLLGGEESGGYANSTHLPDRDGIYNNLLLLELMATEKKSLDEIYAGLEQKFGKHEYLRRDLHLTDAQKVKFLETLKNNPPKEFAGKKVLKIETLDGFKLTFEDESWILLRASGTEPLVRTYAEAKNVTEITKMLDFAQKVAIS